MGQNNLLEISGLTVGLEGEAPTKTIVDNIHLAVKRESITALVGGSGSGKSTTGFSILRLLSPGLEIKSGQILFNQENLLMKSADDMRAIRGKEIAMVFQEPLNAFNPVLKIGLQIEEVLSFHGSTRFACSPLGEASNHPERALSEAKSESKGFSLTANQKKERVLKALDQVGIADPSRVAQSYPHQLSGGMRQRAMIAQAIVGEPSLIIADEPTSNLDVTLQAKVIELFQELRQKLKLSILLITHDLGMVEHLADEVFVLKEGKVVEEGSVQSVLNNPKNAYTVQLMQALKV